MQVSVHFTKIKDEIISHLKKANKEIKVCVAWLTDEDIIRTLTQMKEQGIHVQLAISDSKENFKNNNKFKDFLRFNGELFVSTKQFLHHKFCIIDDIMLINGSYNWSYPARTNEENIMVISLNKEAENDSLLLQKFIVKHNYLCSRCSVPIVDIFTLNSFKDHSIDRALMLAELDETEIRLREEFENDVRKSFAKSIEAKIPVSPSLLDRMKSDGGGVEFVKRILHDEMTSGDMKSGFRKLEESIPHRVDLSLEYLVSRTKYKTLFRQDEVLFCVNLMRKYDL